MLDDNLLRHIETLITDEGLIIEFFDLEDARLFQEGTSEPWSAPTEVVHQLG